MKKIILGIVLIFTVSFAFAANEVSNKSIKLTGTQIEEVTFESTVFLDKISGTCTYIIRAYHSFGGYSWYTDTTYTVEASSWGDCAVKANAHAAMLNVE